MKTDVNALPTRIDKGGVRFQNAAFGELCITRVQLPQGADAGPLLEGMPDHLCPVPHWGIIEKGAVRVRFGDGREEVCRAGEVYYWPPGHTLVVEEEYEAVEFSPRDEMNSLLDSIAEKLS